MMLRRRDALMTTLFGAGHIGLRALATGLPAWFLTNPRRATAQSLQCAIDAKANLQYLILSASSNGDPLNCNCPGTYEKADIIHPQQAEVAATPVQLGSKTYNAALPWASTATGGALAPATLARTAFFHHMTRSTVHGDQPKVMKLLGATSGGEMLVSAYAKHLAACFMTGAERADRRRRARQLQRAGQLRRPHAAVDLADAAQAAAHRLEDRSAGQGAHAARHVARPAERDRQARREQRAEGVPGLAGHVADPGARAGRPAVDDAERDHRRRRQGPGAGRGRADRRQRHVGGDRAPAVRRRQPQRPEPPGRGRPARERHRRESRRSWTRWHRCS